MILISLLLVLSPPQTSTTVVAVRAEVAQTCLVTATRVACWGARDRPGQVRITRGAPTRAPQASDARVSNRASQARFDYIGHVAIVEF